MTERSCDKRGHIMSPVSPRCVVCGVFSSQMMLITREVHASLAARLAEAEALLTTACDAWECGQMVTGRDGVVLADYKAACLPRDWYEKAKGGRDDRPM